ncbi:adenylate kinase [Candidatus Micrarchaeota archaeon]|nr:adenylate kinase [Candidatus Micrarchaeota archaeon]MBU1930588.1 adenylate kinase [Candidatus Micrarchaeota archaeon]
MNLVFLGKQGVGKGTYAQRYSKSEDIPHLSMGDLLRAEIKTDSELGKQIAEIINAGNLVPDEMALQMLEKRLQQSDCEKGFILDGFPRNLNQANLLEKSLDRLGKKIDCVIDFFASEKTLMERLGGRWQCKKCAKIYHTTNLPSKVEGKCDLDGADLYQRADDKPDAIQKRFAIYEEQTKPLIDYYKEKGLLLDMNADRTPEVVLKDLSKKLQEKKKQLQ